ncbi:MAG: 8-oxo-dGTP diphosphatase [Oscillospiraceae bacterium]|nr:8-oxo-dGTP diphosphatase [Oscillospiraceae bacterium]
MTELTTMVMIQNPETGEVLVQERTKKWPGLSFPGGKVDPGESFYDCAAREIKEETGLTVRDLQYCGIVHWCNKQTSDRYLVFLYKTESYSGELMAEFEAGRHFWSDWETLRATPPEKFSNEYVRLYPLFIDNGHSEAFIPWEEDEPNRHWEVDIEFK